MKPLIVLARITCVGCLWSVIFIEGVRVIMLENWHFDIFWPPHWLHAWNLWLSGWVIDTAKEWAFVLILAAFLPLWLTGWIFLSTIAWERLIWNLITLPIRLVRQFFKPLQIVTSKAPVIVKKKSYKEIRPTGPRKPIYDYNDSPVETLTSTINKPVKPFVERKSLAADSIPAREANPLKKRAEESRETFSHSLFNLGDEDDDFELDFGSLDKQDIFQTEKPAQKKHEPEPVVDLPFENEDSFNYEQTQEASPIRSERKAEFEPRQNQKKRKNTDDEINRENKNLRENKNSKKDNNRGDRRRNDERNQRTTTESQPRLNNPVADVLNQKGYDLITGVTVANHMIDFIGVSEDKICVCLIDKESGDWLADEERFNNEEPLWFSESSHRISPVRKVDLARRTLENRLEENGFELTVEPYVVVQAGNIINAEDMFDIWSEMGIKVTRINRGSPKEIKLFSKTVGEAETKMEADRLNELKKLLRNLS